MRRINIVKNKKIETRSFVTEDQLIGFLNNELSIPMYFTIASKIWNLNVGTSYEAYGYKFSCNGKSRAGNYIKL